MPLIILAMPPQQEGGGRAGGGGGGGGVYLNPNNTPLARATGPDKCTSLQSDKEGGVTFVHKI